VAGEVEAEGEDGELMRSVGYFTSFCLDLGACILMHLGRLCTLDTRIVTVMSHVEGCFLNNTRYLHHCTALHTRNSEMGRYASSDS
jgi:hypothetical protein